MWRECLAIKRKSLEEQQEHLDEIHRRKEQDIRNPLINPDHPFIFRSSPPENMVDLEKPRQGIWNIEDHVEGVLFGMDKNEFLIKKVEEMRKNRMNNNTTNKF